jgi:hypothetical protein
MRGKGRSHEQCPTLTGRSTIFASGQSPPDKPAENGVRSMKSGDRSRLNPENSKSASDRSVGRHGSLTKHGLELVRLIHHRLRKPTPSPMRRRRTDRGCCLS